MPPINQQGSRAGLITGLVVFVILFVTAAIFAFQFYGKWQQTDANYTAYKNNYKDIIPDGALQSPQVTDLQAIRSDATNKFGIASTDSVFDAATKQRDVLATAITGGGGTATVAAEQASSGLKDAQKALDANGIKVNLQTTGLAKAIGTLKDALIASQKRIADLNSTVNEKTAQVTAARTEEDQLKAKFDQDLKDAQAKAAADLGTANAAVDASKAVVTSVQADQATATKAASDTVAQKDAEVASLNQQVTKLNQTIDGYNAHLAARRPDVTNSTVRQVDGKLIRIPNNDICYINLGYGDQVTPGLTFEVYDKAEGVPPIPPNVTGDEQLPVGKASIEITHVGTTSSECRIVHIEPGAVLSEGDPIENLVYDSHTKYNFFVYGNFDLANTGRPNPADAEVIKRLITQWGGKLTDKIDVDTDFVVLGSEPVLPTFAKEDLTAENQDKLQKAENALEDYQTKLSDAKQLHIPVMNQNRFLYYVGFYDQAKR